MMRFGLVGRLVLLGSAAALWPAARATAATAATMTIGEPQQGNVKGSKQTKGGSPTTVIELLSVTRPSSDAATGSAAGKRSSSGADTLVVTKYYDSSSAQLEQAASTNEILHQVTIAFETAAAASNGATSGSKVKGNAARTAASASGGAASQSNKAQVLVLKNVQVVEVDQTRNLQKITIEYQSIEVTYASGKPAAATDDWETP
jgi:type VI protein secretion system component Hcp